MWRPRSFFASDRADASDEVLKRRVGMAFGGVVNSRFEPSVAQSDETTLILSQRAIETGDHLRNV